MDPEVTRSSRFDIQLPDGGGRLEAAWIGPLPGKAVTLIFLHEGLGCVDLWRDFPDRLARITGCGALVYSRLGYGRSDVCRLPRPIDFMHHEALTVLPQVLRHCGIREYLLVGHSDGGSIALIHAAGRPAAGLLGVVTIAAHLFREEVTRQSIVDAGRRYREGDLKARLAVYHGENTDAAFRGWHDVWLHPEFSRWDITPFVKQITVPVLAVQGADDPYGTVAQVASIRQCCAGEAAVALIPDCGHAPHLENPGAVLQAVHGWIGQSVD